VCDLVDRSWSLCRLATYSSSEPSSRKQKCCSCEDTTSWHCVDCQSPESLTGHSFVCVIREVQLVCARAKLCHEKQALQPCQFNRYRLAAWRAWWRWLHSRTESQSRLLLVTQHTERAESGPDSTRISAILFFLRVPSMLDLQKRGCVLRHV
jgi:hypothetical protein